MKKKSNKITRLERNRFSILTHNLNRCVMCGQMKDNLHEVFFGTNRINSMKYGLVIPLCLKHHQEVHKNIKLQDYWHKKGQTKFNEVYPDLDFVSIFHRNYL